MPATKWVLDPAHSEVRFKVKHLMVSNVTGAFNSFKTEIRADKDDFTDATIQFKADINSITTGNEQRDQHLKSADFFDSEKFPELTYTATRLKQVDGENYELNGSITIKGVTKPLTLKVEFGGIVRDPWGNTKAGFTLEGKINRKDFGLAWQALTEAGGLVVGEDVKLMAEIELTQEVPVSVAV